MKRFLLLTLVIVALAVTAAADSACAAEGISMVAKQQYHTACYPWHGGYYHSAWGAPVALVVPPTAELETNWGWGVGNTRTTFIWHQFQRNYPGPGIQGPGQFRRTPYWPSDTRQFGVYYVRGPW